MSMGATATADLAFGKDEVITRKELKPFPRHAKQYCDLYVMRQEMQKTRVAVFKEFVAEVRSGVFPEPQHTVDVGQDIGDGFLEAVDN